MTLQTDPLRAVIFDLDGVLVDTSVFHAKAWEELVRSAGYEPVDNLIDKVRGIPRLESLKVALGENAQHFSEEELIELANKKNEAYKNAIQSLTKEDLYEGASALFDDLKNAGIKMAIGSASKNTRPVLELLGISDRFDAISDGFSHTHGKPHPQVFCKAAEMMGLKPHECIVVEDAQAGITAALHGGFVAVGLGGFEALKHAHLHIESLTQIDAQSLTQTHREFTSQLWWLRDSAEEEESELHFGNSRMVIAGSGAHMPSTAVSHENARTHTPGQTTIYVDRFLDTVSEPEKSQYALLCEERIHARTQDEHVRACPDFLALSLIVKGKTLELGEKSVRDFSRRIDTRSGLFCARWHLVTPDNNELVLVQRSIVSHDVPYLVATEYALDGTGEDTAVTLCAGITPHSEQPGYTVTATQAIDNDAVILTAATKNDARPIQCGCLVRSQDQQNITSEKSGTNAWICVTVPVKKDKTTRVERLCDLDFDTKDNTIRDKLARIRQRSYTEIMVESTWARAQTWNGHRQPVKERDIDTMRDIYRTLD